MSPCSRTSICRALCGSPSRVIASRLGVSVEIKMMSCHRVGTAEAPRKQISENGSRCGGPGE
eukprot:3068559-Prymnesium_polylepis.2